MQPDNNAMLQCSCCNRWVHYKCSELPVYMLYLLVISKRKFTCVNCMDVSVEWLETNKDLRSDKTYGLVSCGTQKYTNAQADVAVQASFNDHFSVNEVKIILTKLCISSC